MKSSMTTYSNGTVVLFQKKIFTTYINVFGVALFLLKQVLVTRVSDIGFNRVKTIDVISFNIYIL